MRKYHVVLADGEELDVTADSISLHDGVLVFQNTKGEPVKAYAPGQWAMVEVEARDDR